MTSTTDSGAAVSSLVASYEKTLSQVSVKAVGSQLALMTGISIATLLAFSFFRPREKKVYAPKIKYQLPRPEDLSEDPDYEPPPPPISNGFFAWFSPVLHLKEEAMVANIGLDAATFLRFLRMLRNIFSCVSVLGVALLIINIVYNLKNVDSSNRNALSLTTIADVEGGWMWPAVGASYVINAIVMFFIWRNWQQMVILRTRWFRSPAYQTKIYSRTLMVSHVRKDFRSDAGLLSLMGLLKVDGIKIGPQIEATCIGRRLQDFPEMVEKHNDAVKDLEKHLVKYLKNGQVGTKRPTVRKGGFLGLLGGTKKDAIDYYAKEIKHLRDKIDAKRAAIDSLIRKERHARKAKGGKGVVSRVEGENYGFVTFKTIAEAHRIARAHRGKLKELFGASLQLAPMPHDIVWENISKEPAELGTRRTFGWGLIAIICFFNTIPLLVVSLLANLSALTVYVTFLESWKDAGNWGNWTFSLVSGILPSAVAAIFGYLLPLVIRRVSRYQGAPTRSRLDRAVVARYFSFMIISNLFIFSLLGVVYAAIARVVVQIGKHQSFSTIIKGFDDIPDQIQGTYVQQSTYWLTWLPLRGFLVIFELIQLIKLALVSIRRFMFSYTPRDIREMTKPPFFEYAIVVVNLMFITAVGLIYAPLAPLVAIGATCVFWFSSVVYKYQLLYVYISRAESGGRMWNVYVNRLLACCVLMQLLMVLTTGLIRSRWLDCIAAAPPVLIIIAFKVYITRTSEHKFRYYEPTAEEQEQEKLELMSGEKKRTKHSDMEKRFLHPALQHNKLFTVMVHKQQEVVAREVLSAYPWFAGKHEHDGVEIRAVREENLEYNPDRDGPADEIHQADWDARSVASTDMLSTLGSRSNYPSPGLEDYKQYPLPLVESSPSLHPSVPLDNPSTDRLLMDGSRSEFYGGPQRKASRPYPAPVHNRDVSDLDMADAASPLLGQDPWGGPNQGQGVPYPPSAYTQPPLGYVPPTMRRAASGHSEEDVGVTRWDGGERERRPALSRETSSDSVGYAAARGGQQGYGSRGYPSSGY
ncbi:hypothetical protein L202_05019 [Cryptococcus amylolentus CBS 6039]|uniref:CSC1/OSCA1-like 7TM region domain-containing protein n=1 Tax=Cryptococcus amylolentus CBS 6039 TaxID=1295533 RepID=A0A1E3HNK6_9TREE|nr:hypothetical protein L202_05019 [Cryptococcus amylolentus CBS 6039]ODN77914.1 hypothetical protein L202_05019 [Cryptococcus amylolentus CBS 6039]